MKNEPFSGLANPPRDAEQMAESIAATWLLRAHAETIGFWAGFLTTVSFSPQVLRTWRMGGEGLSWAMLSLFGAGVGLWFVYGLLLESGPLILANGLTGLQVLLILMLKLRRVPPA